MVAKTVGRSIAWNGASAAIARFLQVDVHGAAYSKLVRNDGVTLSGCGAYSCRKFYELHIAKSSKLATERVERMAELWEIEYTLRGQNAEARVAARQERSAAIVTSPLCGRRLCREYLVNPNSLKLYGPRSSVVMYSNAS